MGENEKIKVESNLKNEVNQQNYSSEGKVRNKKVTIVLVSVIIVLLIGIGVCVGLLVAGNTTKIINNKEENQEQIKEDENIANEEEEIKEIVNEYEEGKKTSQVKKSIFDEANSLKYTSNPKDDKNGKIAVLKMGEKVFQTVKHDGYYTYTDNFNNSYNIKEITDITSEYIVTGNDNWANLFKCTVKYLDNNDKNKSLDIAVIVPTNSNEAYIMAPYDNYTGSTSFVKGFTDLYSEDSVQESIFDEANSLKYTSNPKDNINGKIAVLKIGEKVFQTVKHDGYYTYTDNFNNSYNIKEITDITSEYIVTGNDNWANLFKATIKYIDNNNESKSLDIAVIVPTNSDEAYIMAPYDNYTGSTSFVKGFTDLYSEDSE